MNRADVYKVLDSERAYQTNKWGATDLDHSPEEWFAYIEDYIGEAKHILAREAGATARPKAMEIMRKVGGMAVAAMEQHGTNPRA